MCTTHLHHHPCSHLTPCLSANVLSHCPLVQTRLWHYHDQPNQLPLLYPLQIPEVCSPHPHPNLPQPRPPPLPLEIGERVDGSAHVNGEEGGNVCMWAVPWGCGREDGSLCRVGWGNWSCPWVSGTVGGGGGGDGGGGVGAGGAGATAAADAVGEVRNMTAARGVRDMTRPRGMGETGGNQKVDRRPGDSTRIKNSATPSMKENPREAAKRSNENAHNDGNHTDGFRGGRKEQQGRPNSEDFEERRRGRDQEPQQNQSQKPWQTQTQIQIQTQKTTAIQKDEASQEKIKKARSEETEYWGYSLDGQIHLVRSYSV